MAHKMTWLPHHTTLSLSLSLSLLNQPSSSWWQKHVVVARTLMDALVLIMPLNTSPAIIVISHGRVVTSLRRGWIFNDCYEFTVTSQADSILKISQNLAKLRATV